MTESRSYVVRRSDTTETGCCRLLGGMTEPRTEGRGLLFDRTQVAVCATELRWPPGARPGVSIGDREDDEWDVGEEIEIRR